MYKWIISNLVGLLVIGGVSYSYASTNEESKEYGVVGLTTENEHLRLELNASDMSSKNINKTYYSSINSKYETKPNMVSIATIKAIGGTSNVSYKCNFDFTIKSNNVTNNISTKDMYISTSGLVNIDKLSLNEDYEENITVILNGNEEKSINAYIAINNTNSNQNNLSNLNIETIFKTNNLECIVNE